MIGKKAEREWGKKVYVDKSKIQGKGLFAAKDIVKGEIVFFLRGKVVYFEAKTKELALLKPNIMGTGKNVYVDPIPPGLFINHSCNPNLGILGRIRFAAMRDIRKGEELTFDYSISEDSEWEMECLCGEKTCRRVIRGIRSLPMETYTKYLPYIPKYFQKIYKEEYMKNKS